MRAVCNTDAFSKKLSLVTRGVSARSTIQLLGGILLEAVGEAVKLSATDMEISMQTSSPAEVEEEGRVVIPARIFKQILLSLPAGAVSLGHRSLGGTVKFWSGGNEYWTPGHGSDGFSYAPGRGA